MSKNALCEVFNLDNTYDDPIIHEDLEQEYWRMDTTYKGQRLPLHRPRNDGNLVPLEDGDGPPFHVDLFEPYMKYTYLSVGNVMGIEAPEFMSIRPMVIVADVQCQNPRPFDYASHICKEIESALTTIKNGAPIMYFKHYSIFMHMALYYGKELGLWPEELRITQYDKEG